jgi:hypothetical protein
MTIARKPQSVDEFINNSAVAAESVLPVESIANIQPVKLRMPKDLLQDIDEACAKRKPKPSRHQFILEALYEKLAKLV